MTQDGKQRQSDGEQTLDEEGDKHGPDLKKELSSIWRSTLDQLDEIKDAIVRSGDAGRAKLDATFLARQRDKLLLELGRAYLEEIERGGGTSVDSEVQSKVERIRELESQIQDHETEVDRFLGREREETEEST